MPSKHDKITIKSFRSTDWRERMIYWQLENIVAVKTQISDQDFAQIIDQYDLGFFHRAIPVTQGSVQTNYFIHTTTGKFVFRCYENRAKESVLFETELLTYLKTHNYPCAAPIKNLHGEMVGTIQKKPFVLFEFVEGNQVDQPNGVHKQQLIQKTAELQLLTQHYQPKFIEHRWNYDIASCLTLSQKTAKQINTKNAFKKLSWFENELKQLNLPESHPKGICHCDFHFSNVLFQNDIFVALLDFDDANYTFLQFDLVALVDSWAWPHQSDTLNLAKARAIVQAYMQYRPLSDLEQHHFWDVYQLSILFDGIWYFARGDAADFYERRKIRHLQDLGREQLMDGLFG